VVVLCIIISGLKWEDFRKEACLYVTIQIPCAFRPEGNMPFLSLIPTHKHPRWVERIDDYAKKVCERGDTAFAPYPPCVYTSPNDITLNSLLLTRYFLIQSQCRSQRQYNIRYVHSPIAVDIRTLCWRI
jgi:hypothetical protein